MEQRWSLVSSTAMEAISIDMINSVSAEEDIYWQKNGGSHHEK